MRIQYLPKSISRPKPECINSHTENFWTFYFDVSKISANEMIFLKNSLASCPFYCFFWNFIYACQINLNTLKKPLTIILCLDAVFFSSLAFVLQYYYYRQNRDRSGGNISSVACLLLLRSPYHNVYIIITMQIKKIQSQGIPA